MTFFVIHFAVIWVAIAQKIKKNTLIKPPHRNIAKFHGPQE